MLHHLIRLHTLMPSHIPNVHLRRLYNLIGIIAFQKQFLALPIPLPSPTLILFALALYMIRDRVREHVFALQRIAPYRPESVGVVVVVEGPVGFAAIGVGWGGFVGFLGAGAGAGGGVGTARVSVEEGDEEVAHGGDTGRDDYYELFGPENGVLVVSGRRGDGEGGGENEHHPDD